MDISPTALFELLKSDVAGSVDPLDRGLLEAEVSFTEHASARTVACKTMLNVFLKKYGESNGEQKSADRAAFQLFEHWNQKCKDWKPPVPLNEVESTVIGEFRNTFMKCFEVADGQVLNFSETVPQYYRTGPGASVEAEQTDVYSKMYAGRLSTTEDSLYWHYYDSTLPFELEHSAEVKRSARFGTPVVRGSKLGFALKNREISRVRCTEPSLNMIYQLSTGSILEQIIEREFNVRLDDQPDLNRELSRLGSIDKTFGTTDLSSASDATSLGFWNWAMPYPEIRNWFLWIRSKQTKHPFEKGWVDLHVLSSMGNGFTFPLMTLIYLCVVKAVYRTLGIPLIYNKRVLGRGQRKPGNFGVFGDDIIVTTRAFELVNRTLEMLGYKVNTDKSFGSGPFRESCGTDWHVGQNVRGVYCKRLKQPQHRYALINRLNAWSSEWDVPLINTMKCLLKSVWFLPVPPWESASAGVVVPFEILIDRGKLELTDHGSFKYSAMRSKPTSWSPELGLHSRDALPVRGRVNQGVTRQLPENNWVNEFGVVLGYVGGYIRSKRINIRDEYSPFKKTRLTTPGWGFSNESACGFSASGWATYESKMAKVNLGLTT